MRKALILLMAVLIALGGGLARAEGAEAAGPEPPMQVIYGTEAVEAGDAVGEAADEAAEPVFTAEYDYNELSVGTVTPFTGSFFSGMWGNVTSDLDVQLLLHGYNLMEWRGEDGTFAIDPSVVSGMVVTEDAGGDRTYMLTLYDDLYFSDGTRITAQDYAFSILLSIAPQIGEIGGSPRAMEYIQGYEDYMRDCEAYAKSLADGTPAEAPCLSGVRVLRDDMLAVTVSRAYLPFFYELALLDCTPYPVSVIAPGCAVMDDGRGAYIANADPADEAPLFTAELLRRTILDPETGYLSHPAVTSGPYRLTAYDGREVRMRINEYYKGNSDGRKPLIPRLVYKVVDNDALLDQLASGEVALINKCSNGDVLRQTLRFVNATDELTMSNYTRSGLSFISFCCENQPVDRLPVRQAIAMCLDKDGLIRDTVGNYGLRVDGYYGLGQWMSELASGTQAYPVKVPGEDASPEEQAAYEAELEAWRAVNLDEVRVYDLDTAGAAELLDSDGWTLNREGEPFDAMRDDVRCKDVDGVLTPLELRMLCPEGSSLTGHLQERFADHLAEAGVKLELVVLPMQQIVEDYYRRQPRDCDMILLASNFDIVFDPSATFMPDGETINPYNPTAVADDELYRRAVEMRQTRPEDVLEYCLKWVEFEKRFQEVVPAIPIYTNVYFDFYPQALHNYDISGSISWGKAIIGAYMGDASDEEQESSFDEAIQLVDADGNVMEIIDGRLTE